MVPQGGITCPLADYALGLLQASVHSSLCRHTQVGVTPWHVFPPLLEFRGAGGDGLMVG